MSQDLDVSYVFGDKAVAKGTLPPPIEHQYLDQDGQPIDMSVGTWVGQGRASLLYVDDQPVGIGDGSVVVEDSTATATYTWADEDFETIGKFRLIIWVGNGTLRFGSTVYEWDVADAPGDDPTV
jgi:hypothetical protein